MAASIHAFLLVCVFITKFDIILTNCDSTQKFTMLKTIFPEKFEGESHIYTATSNLECSKACFSHSCKSFGIDSVNLKCYLYDFHVWSGLQVKSGTNVSYYWLHYEICPESYTFNEALNFCYKIYKQELNWTLAMKKCIQDGGLLADVDNNQKYSIMVTALALNSDRYFLAGNDKHKEGQWRWLKGTNITHNWNPGEPDSNWEEDCLLLKRGGFFDVRCTLAYPFVCEIPLTEK